MFPSLNVNATFGLLLRVRCSALVTCLLLLTGLSGCAAFRPMEGIPARFLSEDLQPAHRGNKKTINMTLLGQTPPTEYRLDKGDVLAVYIEGVLDSPKEAIPTYYPQNEEEYPAIGYPIKVREDGMISLPPNKKVLVRGMTENEAEAAVRKAFTEGENPTIKADGSAAIMVSLHKKRQYTITVFRQERNNDFNSNGLDGSFNQAGISGVLSNKRGMGRVIQLPAGHNDVLHALAETGGPPGEDAENVIYVVKRSRNCDACSSTSAIPTRNNAYHSDFGHSLASGMPWGHCDLTMMDNRVSLSAPQVIRIPIRINPEEKFVINEEDVILEDGDHIFIEHRDYDVFYTGGVLGGGVIRLPRDRDLDVLEAISVAHDPAKGTGGLRQLGGSSALNRDVTVGASSLIVVRRRADGTQYEIMVDLKEALENPAERIRIQEGDFLFLQYTKSEAIAAFIERHFIDWTAVAIAFAAFQ
ncbi:Polysaccharide biosynthesis/export protein [Polystyrenella longa]|uniref:Polysaccharide biosynthesis/export protein n=1 Tax=Polystyrenella longa TaxID=2528007 RepID=A0A518CPL0_9PLAN|nr:polysaccharide biosynthesis/export family protein [Polystyrenella longa]QDU81153.1 Polysaccharide biosynthesis/export protein [Polystyrenella longa]